MKSILQMASYVVLLGSSFLLGFLGKPTEMGLSILAGAIGLAFVNIDKISRFKGAGFEAEMREEQIETVLEKETEPVLDESNNFIKLEAYGTDDNARKVIKALKNPEYTWRRINGIVRETSLTKEEVENALRWLVDNKLGKKSLSHIGTIWSLTLKGRNVFQSLN